MERTLFTMLQDEEVGNVLFSKVTSRMVVNLSSHCQKASVTDLAFPFQDGHKQPFIYLFIQIEHGTGNCERFMQRNRRQSAKTIRS